MPTNPQSNTNPPDVTDSEVNARLKERFNELPKVVQDAITSADIQKQLRIVSENHKLHVDQWGALENEVTLTLLGFQEPQDLAANIQSEVGISAEEATALAGEINKIVFEPIRQELERGLAHPEAKEKEVSPEEAARQQVLSTQASSSELLASSNSNAPGSPTPPAPALPAQPAPVSAVQSAPPAAPIAPVQPATPPAAKPTEKADRAPISSSYTSRQPSTERKSVTGDPYRELPH